MSYDELEKVTAKEKTVEAGDDAMSKVSTQTWSKNEASGMKQIISEDPKIVPTLQLFCEGHAPEAKPIKPLADTTATLSELLSEATGPIGRRDIVGHLEFSKIGQQKVTMKDGFSFTQNTDGSIVSTSNGSTFVVSPDNTLTVIRANGEVANYKPQVGYFKDGGSISYSYPQEAGFNLVRKHRGLGNAPDTGVEISAGSAQFSTTVRPGVAATFSYGHRLAKEVK